MERVAAFVDGYNLYYGLKSKNWDRYLWLDVVRLMERLLKPDQTLVGTKYFTARIHGPGAIASRQTEYLGALEATGGLRIYYGRYQQKRRACRRCGSVWSVWEEKKTDVNIAVEMLSDAAGHVYDTALLVSGDSDLTPAVETVRRVHNRRVVVAFPPDRSSKELKKRGSAFLNVGRGVIASSQMTDRVLSLDGHEFQRPAAWA